MVGDRLACPSPCGEQNQSRPSTGPRSYECQRDSLRESRDGVPVM